MSSITIDAGGRLYLNHSTNETFAGTLTLNGTLSGNDENTRWDMFKGNSAIVVAAGANALIDENVTLVIRRDNAPITVGEDATLTINGQVLRSSAVNQSGGNDVLVKNGAGKLTLNGNVNVAGVTQNAGTLTIGGAATITTLTQDAGTLTVSGSATVTGDYTGSSGTTTYSVLTVEAGGSLRVDGNLTLRNVNNINDNTHIGATMNVSGDVSVGGNFWIARDGKGIVNINDGGTVVANTLTFGQHWDDSTGTNKTSQVNVATGGKLIAGSIVANTNLNDPAKTSILASSALNLNGGTLGTSADSMTIDVTSGSTALSVVLGTGTTSTINTGKYDTATKMFTNTGAAISIANVISGSGALVKTGAGTLTLSGHNTYSGGTTIEGGVLKVDSLGYGNKGNLGTKFTQDGTVLKNGGVLEVTEAQEATAEGYDYGTGGALRGFSVTVGEGTYRYTGTGTSYIAPNIKGGRLEANSHIGIADGATLIFDVTQGDATLDVSKVIANTTDKGTDATTGALKKIGAGTVILSGANLYSGGTTISAGRLVAAHAGALGTGVVTVESGAELGLVAGTTLRIANGVELASGAKLVVDMTSVASETETFTLDLVSGTALSYNGDGITSANADILLGALELDGWNQSGWTQSLAYIDGSNTLQLTMTIPEPSVFGLLAGLGALALAGTRRRRKRA